MRKSFEQMGWVSALGLWLVLAGVHCGEEEVPFVSGIGATDSEQRWVGGHVPGGSLNPLLDGLTEDIPQEGGEESSEEAGELSAEEGGEEPREEGGEKPTEEGGEEPREEGGEKPREEGGEEPREESGEEPREEGGEKPTEEGGEEPREEGGEKPTEEGGEEPREERSGDSVVWPEDWFLLKFNPVLTPSAGTGVQGADNIYAPHILPHNGQWWMWYGGQGNDGHDAIFVAFSDDLVTWSKYGGNANPIPVVDHGSSNHVNDPSVVFVGGTFFMYYTEAPVAEEDEVHLATSTDGLNWVKQGAVIDVGAPGSWESDRVGRPSVIHEDGEFRMWYDGQIFGVGRHVGTATSPDGFTWTKHSGNPIVLYEGAIDVQRVGGFYVMLAEGHNSTNHYTSFDGLDWQNEGTIFEKSGNSYDAFGQVTPHLVMQQGNPVAIFFGGASDVCWCKNRIAVAFPAGTQISDPGPIEGCSGCLNGFPDCASACQGGGFATGVCALPGSTDPSACCSCSDDGGGGSSGQDCSECLVGASNCQEACQNIGFSSGVCAAPGSTDPDACCACN